MFSIHRSQGWIGTGSICHYALRRLSRFCVASYLFLVRDWECQTVLFSDPFVGLCPVGVSANVFNPSIRGLDRYWFRLSLRCAEVINAPRHRRCAECMCVKFDDGVIGNVATRLSRSIMILVTCI